MNQNLQSSASSGRGLCPEDVVIIVVVAIGFVGSVIIYVLNLASIMVAVFLATGVASLVYRFLGGIQGATFNIGPVKLAGTIAALIGCAYFINMELKCDLSKVTDWFAVDAKDRKGTPVQVELDGVKGSIKKPKPGLLANEPLDIRHEPNPFTIAPKADPDFVLGHVKVDDLREISLFDTVMTREDKFCVTGPLPAGTGNVDLKPLPFRLSTKEYGDDWSYYTLADTSGNILYDKGRIKRKGTEIVKLEGKYYLVGVVAVCHTLKECDTIFAKFIVAEIVTDIKR